MVPPSPVTDPCIFAPMALDDLVHLSALQCFSPSVVQSLEPVLEMREDVKHRHAGDVFSSGTVCSHFGDGQRADTFSPV